MAFLRRRPPSEFGCIDPHSMRDDSHLSGQRDLRTLASFGASVQHAPPKPSSKSIGLMA